MRNMMRGLTAQIGEFRTDIVDVRRDLSQKIAEGSRATRRLDERMDKNDETYADRVAAVVLGQPGSIPSVSDSDPSLSLRKNVIGFAAKASPSGQSEEQI